MDIKVKIIRQIKIKLIVTQLLLLNFSKYSFKILNSEWYKFFNHTKYTLESNFVISLFLIKVVQLTDSLVELYAYVIMKVIT